MFRLRDMNTSFRKLVLQPYDPTTSQLRFGPRFSIYEYREKKYSHRVRHRLQPYNSNHKIIQHDGGGPPGLCRLHYIKAGKSEYLTPESVLPMTLGTVLVGVYDADINYKVFGHSVPSTVMNFSAAPP